MSDERTWFAARLLFASRHQGGPEQAEGLFEERIIVIRAASDHEARRRSAELGKKLREDYENASGETVTWEFKEILDLVPVLSENIEDGSEVYYHFLKRSELDSVRESLEASSL